MRKLAPLLRLRAWTLCLVALGSTLAGAQTAGRVFIQGSEVNLRGTPSPKAEVVTKVPIATECQPLPAKAPKDWVRLKCGEAEGFTLKSLVGPDKPNFDALLAQALDTKASTSVRYDAASRAAALDPNNDKALDLLAELFFTLSFEQLQKDVIKGGLHEAVFIKREYSSALDRQRTLEESFLWELEKLEFDWHQLRFRRGGFRGLFISAMFREGLLFVYGGSLSPFTGKGEFGKELDEFGVVIESRSSSTISEPLKRALQKGARVPDKSESKYSNSLHEEYAGMPALSLEASRVFRSLPPLWYLLQGKKGEWYVQEGCSIAGIRLSIDIHRRAKILAGDIFEYQDFYRVQRVIDVTKTGTSYQFQLRSAQGEPEPMVLTWLTEVPNVAHWNGRIASHPGYYAVAKAKNIPIKDVGCE